MKKRRFTWVKDRRAAIDQLLATNGAHSTPSVYRLTDGERTAATVAFRSGHWTWFIANDQASGRCQYIGDAKARAKDAARAEGLL